MNRRNYSAGMVKLSFWFLEYRKFVILSLEGLSVEDIKRKNILENIFSAPTTARAIEIFSAVSARARGLNGRLHEIFADNDVGTQKLIALIAIMNIDSLFFDFVYEVYREKLLIGSGTLTDSDVNVFFSNKQVQSEKVAGWKDVTLKRLGACYKTLLTEAGLIDRSSNERRIIRPILDKRLIDGLIESGMAVFVEALTGGR